MKKFRDSMALLLCTISLMAGQSGHPRQASHPRAQLGSGPQPERPGDDRERGDVPGWVMITLMSAVLVAALLALAGPALEGLFNQAMDKVGR